MNTSLRTIRLARIADKYALDLSNEDDASVASQIAERIEVAVNYVSNTVEHEGYMLNESRLVISEYNADRDILALTLHY